MVGERRLGVDDQVRVKGTIFLLVLNLWCVTCARKPSIGASAQTTQTARWIDDLGRPTCSALEMQFRCTGGKYRRGHDNAWDADELIHSVRGEIAELLQVKSRLDENLYVRYRVLGSF